MPQGPRGGWVRVAFSGLGAMLCAGLIGCNGMGDKPPPARVGANTKAVGPGLTGTPLLPLPGSQGAQRNGPPTGMYNNVNPAAGIGNAGGVLPAGGIQSQQGMNGAGSTFGNGAPPRQNFNMSNGVVPPAGPGAYPPPNGGSFNQQSGGGINGANLIQQPSGLSDPGPVPPSAPGAPYNSGPLAPPNPNAFGSGRN